MQMVLAALMACLVVVVTAADRFACPDGCTDEAPIATGAQTSSCTICHGWSHAPVVTPSRPSHRLLARQPLEVATPTDPAPSTLERPPKAA